jgi:hypothetical protein
LLRNALPTILRRSAYHLELQIQRVTFQAISSRWHA